MKISNKEIALLGLLNEKPMHGYEIEQEVYNRDMRFWTEISLSSIYKVLKKLEAKGYVRSKVRLTTNNVAQKVDTITAIGKKALRESIAKLFTEFDHHRWEVDLAISNLNSLSGDEAEICINAYIVKMEELLKGYGELQKYLVVNGCKAFRQALAIRPQFLYKAEIEWAKGYLKIIKEAK